MGSHDAILALDQGTTSSRAIVFDASMQVVSVAQEEFPQIFPHEGWVEHDPLAIWQTTLEVGRRALAEAEKKGCRVRGIGITNQRETTVLWNRATGEPLANAIVWQDRRTAEDCGRRRAEGEEPDFQSRTGLLLDPYFSCTKLTWLLDNIENARGAANRGELAFGTVDCWLTWKLTAGRVHATDATNASRTGLFNIHDQDWDKELLRRFSIPANVLPEVRDCSTNFGESEESVFGKPLPILGIAGDQQAAAIGQGCFETGDIKSTYGTGCFVLLNTGEEAMQSANRLLTTVAMRLDGRATYALEGSIFMAGAAIQWLRDGLGIIKSARETESMARSLEGNSGVYVVPAFTGLGAPHWRPDARGAIFGLTRATGPQALVRATLEAVAYQTHDLFEAMSKDGAAPSTLRVDGGMVSNDWLVQFLADILNLTVDRPTIMETTAVGAAYLAGLHLNIYPAPAEFRRSWQADASFTPGMSETQRSALLAGWRDAVGRVLARATAGKI